MTKRFCDLCGAPAIDGRPDFEVVKKGGAEFEAHCGQDCLVVAHVVFTFRQHKSGFGGPPDLCSNCRAKIMSKMLVDVCEPSFVCKI